MINQPPTKIYRRIDRKRADGGYPHFDSVSTTTKEKTYRGWLRSAGDRTTFQIGEIHWGEEFSTEG